MKPIILAFVALAFGFVGAASAPAQVSLVRPNNLWVVEARSAPNGLWKVMGNYRTQPDAVSYCNFLRSRGFNARYRQVINNSVQLAPFASSIPLRR